MSSSRLRWLMTQCYTCQLRISTQSCPSVAKESCWQHQHSTVCSTKCVFATARDSKTGWTRSQDGRPGCTATDPHSHKAGSPEHLPRTQPAGLLTQTASSLGSRSIGDGWESRTGRRRSRSSLHQLGDASIIVPVLPNCRSARSVRIRLKRFLLPR